VALSIGGGANVAVIVGAVIGGLLLLGLAIYLILLWRTAIAEKAEAAAGGEIPSGSRLRRRMVPRMPGRNLKAKVAREVPTEQRLKRRFIPRFPRIGR